MLKEDIPTGLANAFTDLLLSIRILPENDLISMISFVVSNVKIPE